MKLLSYTLCLGANALFIYGYISGQEGYTTIGGLFLAVGVAIQFTQ